MALAGSCCDGYRSVTSNPMGSMEICGPNRRGDPRSMAPTRKNESCRSTAANKVVASFIGDTHAQIESEGPRSGNDVR